MLKNDWKMKAIAMLLIFVLTFADFALVGKSFAVSLFDAFSDNGDTGSKNVEFDASFVVADISEENQQQEDSGSEESSEENQEAPEEEQPEENEQGENQEENLDVQQNDEENSQDEESSNESVDEQNEEQENNNEATGEAVENTVTEENQESANTEVIENSVKTENVEDTVDNTIANENVASNNEVTNDASNELAEVTNETTNEIQNSVNNETNTISEEENNENITNTVDNSVENNEQNNTVDNNVSEDNNTVDNNTSEDNTNNENKNNDNSKKIEGEETKDLKADTNSTNLYIKIRVNILNNGYLKNGKIILGNGEELNFEINKDNFSDNFVQNFEDNTIELTQVNSGTEVEFAFPIYFLQKTYIQEKNISKSNVIRFEGTYVDNDKEIDVSKDVDLNLTWQDPRDIKLSSEITKYIGFSSNGEQGLILQTSVKVDGSTDLKTLPIKNSELEIDVPIINDVKPSAVKVNANSLAGTTGKEAGELEFSEDNYYYDEENNKLNINVENKSQMVSSQNENEILKDETAAEVEAYYALGGIDEYLITYTYSNVQAENITINSKIIAKYIMFGDAVISSDEEKDYELGEQIGDIVTVSTSSDTQSISKVYTYLNYNNDENKNEVEIDDKIIFNISYKDIVDSIYYEDTDKSYVSGEETYGNDDVYYKTIKINQSNFYSILGESGYANIYNGDQIISTINKDMEVDENGDYIVNLDSSVKSIRIECSKPIDDGNLIFLATRAYQDVSYGKDDFKNFDKIVLNSVGKAKYSYVDDLVDCGNSSIEVNLDNTSTNANISIGQESLSTLTSNNDVEIKIELNNDKPESDVYGHSEFIVKMPQYTENVDITDTSIVYGDGLELTSVDKYQDNGDWYIKAIIDGFQTNLSSGILTNGTNIVIKTNIKTDLYAPLSIEKFEMRYTNDEVTAYQNEVDGGGYAEAEIKLSAPSGVVTVNSISDFDDTGKIITSIRQGKVEDQIPIYSGARNAKMELTIMNNEENPISDFKILGRTIFAGNKDVETGDDLGTTKDAPIASEITGNEGFTVYYSEYEDATEDLEDELNGWTTQISDFSKIKSYLIVPNDSAFVLNPTDKLRFSYEFTIPENLAHNEYFYGSYGAYYRYESDLATTNELSAADIVGLTTGEGPELEVTTTSNKTSVNEYEEYQLTTNIKNVGDGIAKNIVVKIPVPENINYLNSNVDEGIQINNENNTLTYTIPELASEGELTLVSNFEVQEFDGEDNSITVYSVVTADDLGIEIKTDDIQIGIVNAKMRVLLTDYAKVNGTMVKNGATLRFNVKIKNLTDSDLSNVMAYIDLPEPAILSRVRMAGDIDGPEDQILADVAINQDGDRFSWTLDNLPAGTEKAFLIEISIGELQGTELLKDIDVRINVNTGDEIFQSGMYSFQVGKESIIIKQTSNTENTYVKDTDTIEYVFSITNEGPVDAKQVTLTDQVPKGLIIKEARYSEGNEQVVQPMSESNSVTLLISVASGETKEVTLVAQVNSLNGAEEMSVTNVGQVAAKDQDSSTSNPITHIIEATSIDGKSTVNKPETYNKTNNSGNSGSSGNNTAKSYSISGVAWNDKNKNGARDDGEDILKGIKVTLVDSERGVIKSSGTTNSKGEYKFTGVLPGNYIVIFDYDTKLYTVTTFKKENVASNINSDVISTRIEQDGKIRNGAVSETVTISDVSISNIDIGLIDATKFDLNLSMGITKVTVQNRKGTKSNTYNSIDFAKTEISQRYIDGSEVYVEYTFTLKNEGELAGTATEIVDFIPEGMNFNSGLRSNEKWYTGNDGNLYTGQFENYELQPGEAVTFTLVLSKIMSKENTGIVSNTAEINADYNIYGITDVDSTPGNKNQDEDDFARADIIITVGTGARTVYASLILTTLLLVGLGITILKIKNKKVFIQGGV